MNRHEVRDQAVGRLIETWTAWGATLRPGVPQQELDAFEAKRQVHLPLDFRDYLLRCNGFEGWGGSHGNDWRGLIDFLPLESMEWLPPADANADISISGPSPAYFAFADYLISSHLYAIGLSADPPAPTPVVAWFGDDHVYEIATSFAEFVGVYLDEPDRLWPKPVDQTKGSRGTFAIL